MRTTPQDDSSPCGGQVKRFGETFFVTPSGVEDTEALQCALDHARAGTVRLAPGVFRIAQIVAVGFVGQLVGAGEGRTTITNVERPLQVAALNWNEAPPSAANPWPALLTFVDSWFGVSQLTVHVTGTAPTTLWTTQILGGGNVHIFRHQHHRHGRCGGDRARDHPRRGGARESLRNEPA